MSGQHERRWNVGDDRYAEGELGDKPDQERAQRYVRRSGRLRRRSRRGAGGDKEREQIGSGDKLGVCKASKGVNQQRMSEDGARELSRRRTANVRDKRACEGRFGELTQVKTRERSGGCSGENWIRS